MTRTFMKSVMIQKKIKEHLPKTFRQYLTGFTGKIDKNSSKISTSSTYQKQERKKAGQKLSALLRISPYLEDKKES